MRRPPPKHGEKRMWRAGCLCPACRAAATEDQAPRRPRRPGAYFGRSRRG